MTDVYYLIVSPPWIGLEGRYEKGARVDTYTRMLQPHVKQSSKSHSGRGARKGQNTKTTILYIPDLTTNY